MMARLSQDHMTVKHPAVHHNQRVHDACAAHYDSMHHEIYNPTEQYRLAAVLLESVSQMATPPETLTILDLGAGTGNLTTHLLRLGAHVVAADVSQKSLQRLTRKFPNNRKLRTVHLNGTDLAGFEDDTFDMVATYSVLHHIPDYLGAVGEMIRTTKPGGLIFIDHEKCPSFWLGNSPVYDDYRQQLHHLQQAPAGVRRRNTIRKIFSMMAWRRLINRRFFGLNAEGDIHVTCHDHIEWDRLQPVLGKSCDLVRQEDYLLCEEQSFPATIYEQFRRNCSDMRYVLYRKRHPTVKPAP
ncbi:MAG: class I SAM-dependent methyltransferase [bacterium]